MIAVGTLNTTLTTSMINTFVLLALELTAALEMLVAHFWYDMVVK